MYRAYLIVSLLVAAPCHNIDKSFGDRVIVEVAGADPVRGHVDLKLVLKKQTLIFGQTIGHQKILMQNFLEHLVILEMQLLHFG